MNKNLIDVNYKHAKYGWGYSPENMVTSCRLSSIQPGSLTGGVSKKQMSLPLKARNFLFQALHSFETPTRSHTQHMCTT